MRSYLVVSLALLAATAAACSSGKSSSCNPSDPRACPSGAVCESVEGGGSACYPPIFVAGRVTDLGSGLAVAGARVVALDANRAPASAVGTTDAAGNYRLSVPATREPNGTPAASNVTIRADAQGYQSFPGGVRSALPFDLSAAVLSAGAGGWELNGPLTQVGLIQLPDTSNLLSLSGTVEQPPSRVGLLVTAEPESGGSARTAIADTSGSYTIFNLPADATGITYDVAAYGRGVNYAPATATLTIGLAAPTVNLAIMNGTTATIDGSLIFNSGATTPTSVALVVRSTYSAVLDRGETPPALVAQVPSGSTYALGGVPDGRYVALAAFGIDGDVRDLSGTGNTAPLEVEILDGALVGTLGQFKLVGAIDLTSIDGVPAGDGGVPIRLTSATPTFEWAKAPSYSSAATYQTDVLDAFGANVWTHTQSGSGSGPFTATYAGEPLRSGMYYQLRIKAFDTGGSQLSQTEDLKGVFFMP